MINLLHSEKVNILAVTGQGSGGCGYIKECQLDQQSTSYSEFKPIQPNFFLSQFNFPLKYQHYSKCTRKQSKENGHLTGITLMYVKLLQTDIIRNVQRPVRRICTRVTH